MTSRDILEQVEKYNCKNVIFTGGEPMINDLWPLQRLLKQKEYHISIETNGTIIPEDAIALAGRIISDQALLFVNFEEEEQVEENIEGDSKEIADEVVEVEVPEEAIKASIEPEISQEQLPESTGEISDSDDVDGVVKVDERAVQISTEGTVVTIAASDDDGVSIDGTTLKAFNSSTFEISGSGFLSNSTLFTIS